jgi:hypothetical protein
MHCANCNIELLIAREEADCIILSFLEEVELIDSEGTNYLTSRLDHYARNQRRSKLQGELTWIISTLLFLCL